MNAFIYKRKSIRKYDINPLDESTLNKVIAKFDTLIPLFSEIQYSISIVNKTHGLFNVKAPHYILFGSEKKPGYLENIGFIGQQLDLFLSEIGLGACWLGVSKPGKNEMTALPYVICIGFGKPAETLYRKESDFKRKSLSEISTGNDPRLNAARVAPSGTNAQNWFFAAHDGVIDCYRKKPPALLNMLLGNMSYIDMGIALCHIAEESGTFNYIKRDDVLVKKGFEYLGTVKS